MGVDPVTVRFRPWAYVFAAVVGVSAPATAATDGMRYLDHWKSLGISSQDINLIDRYDIDKDVVERLANDGVSVREYVRKPWLEMGLSESDWFDVLEMGSDIASLERTYDREEEGNERPNLAVAFLLPGYQQIKEDRIVSGGALAVAGVGFAALTFLDRDDHTGGGIKFTWPVLWGLTSLISATDIWNRYYREQSLSGFTLDWQPNGRTGLSWRHSL